MSVKQTDAELWREFREGNRQAYSSIFHTYYSGLYHYGMKLSGDSDLIKDDLQDLFIYLWENRQKLSETTSIKFYLMKSFRRKIGKSASYAKRSTHTYDASAEYEGTVVSSHETHLIDEQMFREQQDQLLVAFNGLSKRQREVLYLRFYSNLSYLEIAEVMSLNYQSVRNYAHQGITMLRKRLLSLVSTFYFLILVSWLLH